MKKIKSYTGIWLSLIHIYIKADDIVLKNKGGQPAGNPQNHAPQGQAKK